MNGLSIDFGGFGIGILPMNLGRKASADAHTGGMPVPRAGSD